MALTCLQPAAAGLPYEPGDLKGALRSFVTKLTAERCGKPAIYRDEFGRTTCEACAAEMKRAHADGETILSMLRPAMPPRFTPIQ